MLGDPPEGTTSLEARSCMDLSIVIAVGDVEESIGRDVRRVVQHLRALGLGFEILAVNDGCCDNSPAVLRLLEPEIPELRALTGDAAGRAFLRGAAEARGPALVLWDAGGGAFPLAALGWALQRLAAGKQAIVLRGRCIVGARLACLPALVGSSGRGLLFERTFERQARDLDLEIVGARRRAGLLEPVLRFLAA